MCTCAHEERAVHNNNKNSLRSRDPSDKMRGEVIMA